MALRRRASAAPRDRGRRPITARARHERVPVPVDDRAALGAHGNLASLVRVRARGVLRAGENLQRPEPHHERREADEEKRAEDREPPRELRRDAIRLDGGLGLGPGPPCPRTRPAAVLAKELHLRTQLARRLRPQQPAHDRVDRDR